MRVRLLLPAAALVVGVGAAGVVAAPSSGHEPALSRSATVQPASWTGQTPDYGFNDLGLGNAQIPHSVFLDKLEQSGAHLIRSGINWQIYEPQPGQYNDAMWARLDQNYRDLLKIGVRQVITLITTPYWALTLAGRGAQSPDGSFRCDGSSAPCVAPPDIRNPLVRIEWQHFVREVVARYPQAAAVEVWNEPNVQGFWLQPQNPRLYARLLKATTTAVRQVSPTMPVLVGSLGGFVGASTMWNTAADTFLADVYRDAGRASFNAIGWHLYPCNNGQSIEEQGAYLLSALRGVRNAFNDSNKPLWLTETGFTSGSGANATCGGGSYTEQQQAELLGETLDWATAQDAGGDLPVVLVYSLFDVASRQVLTIDNPDGASEYGVIAYHYDPLSGESTFLDKPAFAAVQCRFTSAC